MMLSSVEVIAAGTTGTEEITLEINGADVQTWNDLGDGAYGGQFVSRSFETAGALLPTMFESTLPMICTIPTARTEMSELTPS